MNAVTTVRGTMLPLDRVDVDTDQIIPQQFLKRIQRHGFGEFLFHSWAHDAAGRRDPSFVINRPEYRSASIIVTGPNMGCGSSREHAAWSLQDWGIRAVVAPSVADIFRNNCHNIGLLVVELPQPDVRILIRRAADPTAEATIDLATQTVTSGGFSAGFDIDQAVKQRLLEGLDDIDVTLGHGTAIDAHETARPRWMPRLHPA